MIDSSGRRLFLDVSPDFDCDVEASEIPAPGFGGALAWAAAGKALAVCLIVAGNKAWLWAKRLSKRRV